MKKIDLHIPYVKEVRKRNFGLFCIIRIWISKLDSYITYIIKKFKLVRLRTLWNLLFSFFMKKKIYFLKHANVIEVSVVTWILSLVAHLLWRHSQKRIWEEIHPASPLLYVCLGCSRGEMPSPQSIVLVYCNVLGFSLSPIPANR